MPKLAIYVSKQDMKAIERWRKRINFSKVFIRAVFEEIRRLERLAGAPEGKVAAAAEYYRGKLSESAGPVAEFGFELGSSHVLDCRLSPETIRQLLELKCQEAVGEKQRKIVDKAIGDDMHRVNQCAQEHGFHDEQFPTWRDAVYRSYLSGVAAAWERVCAKMREEGNKSSP